jgi:hypothetical protein
MIQLAHNRGRCWSLVNTARNPIFIVGHHLLQWDRTKTNSYYNGMWRPLFCIII